MRGGDLSYPGVKLTAWNIAEDGLHYRYLSMIFLGLPIIPIHPVGQMWSAALNCDVHCVAILHQYK